MKDVQLIGWIVAVRSRGAEWQYRAIDESRMALTDVLRRNSPTAAITGMRIVEKNGRKIQQFIEQTEPGLARYVERDARLAEVQVAEERTAVACLSKQRRLISPRVSAHTHLQ